MAKDLMEMTSVLKGVPEALQPIFKEVKRAIQSKAMQCVFSSVAHADEMWHNSSCTSCARCCKAAMNTLHLSVCHFVHLMCSLDSQFLLLSTDGGVKEVSDIRARACWARCVSQWQQAETQPSHTMASRAWLSRATRSSPRLRRAMFVCECLGHCVYM